SAGHNGLKNIEELTGGQNYPRLRVGIGSDFGRGQQVDYVLSRFSEDEFKQMPEVLDRAGEAITTFCLAGLVNAMNTFNR
ncbi:MAG: aminoacyl-tRNA hydrolase, partial [Cyclobacteriaceae bacterium]